MKIHIKYRTNFKITEHVFTTFYIHCLHSAQNLLGTIVFTVLYKFHDKNICKNISIHFYTNQLYSRRNIHLSPGIILLIFSTVWHLAVDGATSQNLTRLCSSASRPRAREVNGHITNTAMHMLAKQRLIRFYWARNTA